VYIYIYTPKDNWMKKAQSLQATAKFGRELYDWMD